MKSTIKILTAALMVLLIAAVFAKAQPPQDERPQDVRGGPIQGHIEQILNDIRAKDPDEADRLQRLREDDPQQFHMELRKIVMKDMPQDESGQMPGPPPEGMRRKGREGGPEQGGREDMRGMAMERGRERLRAVETELMTWLEKNEPQEANDLTALKEKEPQAYMRKMAINMRKYRQIIETEATNPALAEVLKKDLKLKQQRNELLEKLKAATDEKQKETLTAELKGVVSQRFDVIVQKKQLQYEELKKKLEELQNSVNKSQTELDKFKNNKEEQVNKYLESIANQSERFDWD